MITTLGAGFWAKAGRAISFAPAAHPAALCSRVRRDGRLDEAHMVTTLTLGAEPVGNGANLLIGETLGDAIHDGSLPLPAAEPLHRRDDV
jgi:hypothetical protein